MSEANGPLVIDLAGCSPTEKELEQIRDSRVGGLILFSRNFESIDQLTNLVGEVRAVRPSILIAVDHEGGRVQRFRKGFTRLPAMRRLGQWYDRDCKAALLAAHDIGYVLAAELRGCDIDLSFTPVLDLDWGRSAVIGDRSLHHDPHAVSELASALVKGLHAGGVAACGKHFPGHGWVAADSHLEVPIDERDLLELQTDISPFRGLQLDAIMPAHVIYPAVDSKPAGFSPHWIRFLRQNVGFSGVVISDDLSMAGASVAGDVVERVEAAWSAGCDLLLVCNAPDKVDDVLARWRPRADFESTQRLACLCSKRQSPCSPEMISANPIWQSGVAACNALMG